VEKCTQLDVTTYKQDTKLQCRLVYPPPVTPLVSGGFARGPDYRSRLTLLGSGLTSSAMDRLCERTGLTRAE
jgi:hypothetical protein